MLPWGRHDYSYFLSPSSAELSPFVPTTPFEMFLAVVFVFPSLAFLLYLACVFYSIFCSRNYAEWRSSWSGGGKQQQQPGGRDVYSQIVQESAPIMMEGHGNEVECMVACESGGMLASLCLGGTVRTWDSVTGDLLAHIDRQAQLQR